VFTSARSFQRASGSCSSTSISSRRGHWRRSATLRTHGTRPSDARAASRSIVKNVPRSSLRITASRCGPLVRASGVVTTTSRYAKPGRRVVQPTSAHARNAAAMIVSVTAIAFNWRASSHMRTSQDFDAKIGE
jgi:hypothetical protein